MILRKCSATRSLAAVEATEADCGGASSAGMT
jgi:hypothetical protein